MTGAQANRAALTHPRCSGRGSEASERFRLEAFGVGWHFGWSSSHGDAAVVVQTCSEPARLSPARLWVQNLTVLTSEPEFLTSQLQTNELFRVLLHQGERLKAPWLLSDTPCDTSALPAEPLVRILPSPRSWMSSNSTGGSHITASCPFSCTTPGGSTTSTGVCFPVGHKALFCCNII